MCESVEYLGHKISNEGLHATDEKIKAILEAPIPKNVKQLRSFHYYSKFIPNLASKLTPLNHLLRKHASWEWTTQCEEAMLIAKEKLVSAYVLVHCDSQLPLKLCTDASPNGVGAVLSYEYPDGTDQPILYASRSLTPTESNYAQREKVALSIIFGIRKFYEISKADILSWSLTINH